jgi:hypothetical protein
MAAGGSAAAVGFAGARNVVAALSAAGTAMTGRCNVEPSRAARSVSGDQLLQVPGGGRQIDGTVAQIAQHGFDRHGRPLQFDPESRTDGVVGHIALIEDLAVAHIASNAVLEDEGQPAGKIHEVLAACPRPIRNSARCRRVPRTSRSRCRGRY